MRKALSPGLKIAITVTYLASGEKYPSLMYSFRVTRNTICMGRRLCTRIRAMFFLHI